MPSEEEEDEVNRGMRTEYIAEMINRLQLNIRKDGQAIISNNVYMIICHFPYIYMDYADNVIDNYDRHYPTHHAKLRINWD